MADPGEDEVGPGQAGEPGDATRLLMALREESAGGRARATERLTELLYPELRRIASRLMRREREGHTLQPTAIVHEAFLRLVNQQTIEWEDRAHFLGIAARVMRRILVEHARRHGAAKRGGGVNRVTLDEALVPSDDATLGLVALDEVLTRFAAVDPRGARVAELRIFGGLTVRETALELGVSPRTVNTDWTMARLWLARELSA
ncbi:MAG: sigma-70 family RNA polymerase sigma factor [Vicinamibacterales bacterium]